MSPIFVRPVREQLEHDRLIRFLQAKYKKKQLEVVVNVGDERLNPVKIGPGTFFPDLVMTAGKKLAGLVEVETGESVNNLEAMAQWVHFSRARVPFHLYVPVTGYDTARRLCEANGARPAEIWTYRVTLDGFDLVRMFHDAASAVKPAAKPAAKAAPPPKPKPKPAPLAKKAKAPKAKAPKAPKVKKPAKAAASKTRKR